MCNYQRQGLVTCRITLHGLRTIMILAGLATAETERTIAGRKALSVRRIKITDAGREAL